MPYDSKKQLPASVRGVLPDHAQDIYKEAFNAAWDTHEEEKRAHRIAWGAVKESYEKNESGKWVKK